MEAANNQAMAQSYFSIRSELRSTLLVSKRNIDSQNASNREELFRSNAVSDEKAVSGEKTT